MPVEPIDLAFITRDPKLAPLLAVAAGRDGTTPEQIIINISQEIQRGALGTQQIDKPRLSLIMPPGSKPDA